MYKCLPNLKLSGLAALVTLAFSPIQAQEITLKSLDGTVSMTGDLIEFDGISYRISMLIGEISIDASQVVCEGPGCPNLMADQSEFSIAGSNGIGLNLLPTLIEVYALDRGGDLDVSVNADGTTIYNVLDPDGAIYASISVQATDSIDGFSKLLDGSAAIAMSSRAPSADEIAAFELSGNGSLNSAAQENIIALDGVIAAVNKDNPVDVLSLAQISAIFEGDITNWNQVGGATAPIRLYRRNDTSGTTVVFTDIGFADGEHALTDDATILATDAAVSDAVAGDINGIGLTSYAQERSAKAVALRSVCGGLYGASEFAIKTEEYPLTRRMYLYTAQGSVPNVAQEFLDFASSATAQSVIANSGFIGQNVSRNTLDQQGRRMAQAIVSSANRSELLQLQDLAASVLDATRLSFTLRFEDDGQLDARALADVERLGAMIRDGEFASRQILVLGFSDDTNAVNAQLNATQDMAETVRDAVVIATGRANMGNVRISPIGYGRLFPVGCNATASGRDSNNRVEIWVK